MLHILSIFGQLETFFADGIYPYRYIVGPLLVLLAGAAIVVAYRAGVHLLVWRHRIASLVVAAPLLVVAVVAGNYLLSPLWESSHLVEASPLAATQSLDTAATQLNPPPAQTLSQPAVPVPALSQPAGAQTSRRGSFSGADDFHFGRGQALLIKTGDGKDVLRLEDFAVRNGPDLYVYLSKDPTGRKVEEKLNLGALKATSGAFNYEIPQATDLAGVESVVIWCKQFGVLFASAPLKTS